MNKVYPEIRGSHLSSERERKRALRRLRKIERKKREREKAAMISSVTKEQETGKPTPRRRASKIIAATKRDVILSAVQKHGKDSVVATMCKLVPTKSRLSHFSALTELIREPEHHWNSTSLFIFDRLATSLSGAQQQLPIPKYPATQEPKPASAVTALAPVVPQQQVGGIDMTTLTQVVTQISAQVTTTVLSALGIGVTSSPVAQPAQLPPVLKDFAEMTPEEQRHLLNVKHKRYADHLRSTMGVVTGEYSAAWRRSYEAYERETGVDVIRRAESTGVRPLDVIESDGNLVRFWQIIRNTWER